MHNIIYCRHDCSQFPFLRNLPPKIFHPHFIIRILPSAFCHPHFVIRILSSAFCHPHFVIRILSSAFCHPHFVIRILVIRIFLSAIRHPPSAAIRSALYRDLQDQSCSASDSVGLTFTRSYRSTLPITTPTTTPSLLKTNLNQYRKNIIRLGIELNDPRLS